MLVRKEKKKFSMGLPCLLLQMELQPVFFPLLMLHAQTCSLCKCLIIRWAMCEKRNLATREQATSFILIVSLHQQNWMVVESNLVLSAVEAKKQQKVAELHRSLVFKWLWPCLPIKNLSPSILKNIFLHFNPLLLFLSFSLPCKKVYEGNLKNSTFQNVG